MIGLVYMTIKHLKKKLFRVISDTAGAILTAFLPADIADQCYQELVWLHLFCIKNINIAYSFQCGRGKARGKNRPIAN